MLPPLIANLQKQLAQQTGAPVELLETHISWVLLAGDFAYKLKKPVQFPFLDFSTPALRQHFCNEELRLNQRLAPEIYLDTVSMVDEVTAETAVRMHRFAPEALLQNQLAHHKTTMTDMRKLAQRLAHFHLAQTIPPPKSNYGSPHLIQDEVAKVLQTLKSTAFCDAAPHWEGWVNSQAKQLQTIWQERQNQGCIRECHGDLHLGNIVKLANGTITAFDCIEFQPAMRWIDTVNDTAFLTMDLQVHGRADLAAGFMDDYLQTTGDYAGLATWRFYEVYRALVRAMVAQLSTHSKDPEAGKIYADWLHQVTAANRVKPRLWIMHGMSGSGKSSVARQLVEQACAIRVRSDVERKRLFGLTAQQNSHEAGVNIYTASASQKTFQHLHDYARLALRSGYNVVVDAAFLRYEERRSFAALATELNVAFQILSCEAPAALLESRIAERLKQGCDASEATSHVLQQQMQAQEPLHPKELPCVHWMKTGQMQADELVKQFIKHYQ